MFLLLAFTNKSEQNQKTESVQQALFSQDSQNKIMKLLFENIQYPIEAKNKGMSGRFFVIVKMEKGGKISNITINDKDNSINIPLVTPNEVVVTGLVPKNDKTDKSRTEFVTKNLSVLENEGIRVAKMLESLKLPEWQNKGIEFAIPFNFKLTKD